ncbi:MAG: fumarate hydratase, partial [Lachnospiraceae bacterium]|nr:fumarate hydratase [Lachnospiraceae bacterium]
MREINAKTIIDNIKEMCIEANLYLTPDMKDAVNKAKDTEKNELGHKIMDQLIENLKIADTDQIPICQDTGMAIVFVKLGQDVHVTGMSLTDAINEGVRRGYVEGFLRKSVVSDPIIRKNTNDNTPAIIHYDIVDGENIEITVAPKGFGSENMSKMYMLKPADGIEGIKASVIDAVSNAGPNACPPFVVGVGIGGNFEKAAILAKTALTRDINSHHPDEHIAKLEDELFSEVNALGIGPAGLGGSNTALAINIETFATHIA